MSIVFPVEAGHVMMFARALGEPGEAYELPAVLGPQARSVEVPPTFVIASAHFDPDYPMRPREGSPWKGSPREAAHTGDGAAGAQRLYAEQHFEYHAAVCIGDVLHGENAPGRSWSREGRTGRLNFEESVTVWSDSGGRPAVTSRRVVVASQPHPGSSPPRAAAPAGGGGRGEVRETANERRIVLVENLRRSTLVQYAGASGDFNPLHTDEVYATQLAHRPTIVAHGMFTMGIASRGLAQLGFGYRSLARLGARFRAPVWPGDTLSLAVSSTTGEREISFAVTNGAEATVLTGTATLRQPAGSGNGP